MKRPLKDKKSEILNMHHNGATVYEIADVFGVTPEAIRYQFRLLGVEPNKVIKNFTDEEISLIKLRYKQRKGFLDIAKEIVTTQSRISNIFSKLGFDSSSYFFRKEEEDDLRRLYEVEHKTIQDIAEIYGCYRQAVDVAFDRFNIKPRNHEERKQIMNFVNRDAFTDWTKEENLFYYGLLLADGCLSDNNSISIALQYGDKHIIESFKEYMQSGNTLQITEPCEKKKSGIVSFSFMDAIVANNLRKAGMESRKSAMDSMPLFDMSDLNIARHFWRGYICGDGSVRSYKSNNNKDKLIPSLHICGSYEICKGFADFCSKVLGYDHGTSVKAHKDKRRTKVLYYFKMRGSKARDVSCFMFDNSKLFINRKMHDVQKFKQWNPSPSGKVYGVYQTKYGTWRVYFCFDGKQRHVGTYNTEQEAIDVRLGLELKHYGKYKVNNL